MSLWTVITGCLHVPIVGPTGRSDPRYVRLSVRPVGQTGRTDCSRTAHICQSHQCGLLADYNTAYAAAWLVVRLASRSDQSDIVSTRFDSRIGSRTKSTMFDSSTVCPTVGRSVYMIRSSDRPCSRTDLSDRPVGPTIGTCKRPLTRMANLGSAFTHHLIHVQHSRLWTGPESRGEAWALVCLYHHTVKTEWNLWQVTVLKK